MSKTLKTFLVVSSGFLMAAATFLFTGCAQLQATNTKIAQDVQNIVAPVQQATLADAQAALARAQATGDTDVIPCYQDIVDVLSTPGTVSLPPVVGVLSALEAARTLKPPSLPPKLHRDCAVLVVDAQEMAFKLGLTLAPVAGAVKVQQGAAAVKAEAAALQAVRP